MDEPGICIFNKMPIHQYVSSLYYNPMEKDFGEHITDKRYFL